MHFSIGIQITGVKFKEFIWSGTAVVCINLSLNLFSDSSTWQALLTHRNWLSSLSLTSLCFRLLPPGETIRIVIEEYVQHLSGYLLKLKFDPTLLFKSQFQYANRISLEFSQLYHWHPLMPDSFLIDGDELSYPQFLFNTSVLTYYGVEKLVDAFSRQVAGQVIKATEHGVEPYSFKLTKPNGLTGTYYLRSQRI